MSSLLPQVAILCVGMTFTCTFKVVFSRTKAIISCLGVVNLPVVVIT